MPNGHPTVSSVQQNPLNQILALQGNIPSVASQREIRPQVMNVNWDDVRKRAIAKFPNMSKADLTGLNEFIEKKKNEQYAIMAATPGSEGKALLDPEQAIKIGGQGIIPQLLQLNIPPALTEAEKKKRDAKQNAERIITQLEDQYFGLPGKGDELSYGGFLRLGGRKEAIKAKAGKNPKLKVYKDYIASIRPTMARAAGDSGNFSEPEQKAAVKIIPTELSTPEEAVGAFYWLRKKFDLPERDLTAMGAFQGTDILPAPDFKEWEDFVID